MLNKLINTDSILIIDDFLESLDPFLAFSEGEFARSETAHYPGRIRTLTPELMKSVHGSLDKSAPELINYLRSGRIRITDETSDPNPERLIHYDLNSLILVCYLILPTDTLDQGTSFHMMPGSTEKKIKSELTKAQFFRQELLLEKDNYEHWKIWQMPTPVVNRAILFDGHLFHSGPRHLTGTRVTLELNFQRFKGFGGSFN